MAPIRREMEPIVYPWMAVVVNIAVELRDGRPVGDSGRKLKEEWAMQGYNPLKVHPLWSKEGHSGTAIVEFTKDWAGFKNAIMFEKAFEMENHGKRDWYGQRDKVDNLYAWIARDEEYNSKWLIGKYLRKHANLTSIPEIEREEKRRDAKLVCILTNELEMKDKQREDIERKISRTETFLWSVMREKEKMVQELQMREQLQRDHLQSISIAHERSKSQLEAEREELRLFEKGLKEREAFNGSEKMKLDHLKQMNEKAIMEQKKADENMLKLAEVHKTEKYSLLRRIIELEKKLDDKQLLELEIEQMKGAIEVMKHMGENGDPEVMWKMESIIKNLKQKEEDLEGLEALSRSLIKKERESNDELQAARNELISGLNDWSVGNVSIGVKRMGDLDEKPFHVAAKRKYPAEEAREKAMELASLWDYKLRDSSWHPFKVIL